MDTNHDLRLRDLNQFNRGEIIPPEILEQSHWAGLKRDDRNYAGKIAHIGKWIQSYFLNKKTPVVCKQTDYGLELLYGSAAMHYLQNRSSQQLNSSLKLGEMITSHVSRADLDDHNRKRQETLQNLHSLRKQAVLLAEAQAVEQQRALEQCAKTEAQPVRTLETIRRELGLQ
jgi:hypothetical protein